LLGENKTPEPRVEDIDRSPLQVEVGGPIDFKKLYEQIQAEFAAISEEKYDLIIQVDTLKAKLKTKDILDNLIEPYAKKAYNFMCAYSAMVGAILVLHGFKIFGFTLPDAVLSFLVGSTAVTVIGLVGMVLTGIFVGARPKH
jgi:hypothetical protein